MNFVLQGFVTATVAATVEWTLYGGNGAVQFDDAAKTNAVVAFTGQHCYAKPILITTCQPRRTDSLPIPCLPSQQIPVNELGL